MLSAEHPLQYAPEKNKRAVVARAALQGSSFLLHPEHVPVEEPVAPISPQDSRRGADPLVCACCLAGQLQKPQCAQDPAWAHSAFLRARLLPWCPGLLGAQGSMPNLQRSLAGWPPQAVAGRWLSSRFFMPFKGFASTLALARLPQLCESPAGCHVRPPPPFPSSTASLQLRQPPGLGDFAAWYCCLAKSRRGREGIKQGHRVGWRTAPEERMPAREDLAHPALLEVFPGLR